MLHLAVLRAFFGARVTDVGAGLADGAGTLAAARHIGGREAADLGAVDVERYAARHRLYILFLQARRGAVVAGLSASIAGIDAGLVLLMRHGDLLSSENTPCNNRSQPLHGELGNPEEEGVEHVEPGGDERDPANDLKRPLMPRQRLHGLERAHRPPAKENRYGAPDGKGEQK